MSSKTDITTEPPRLTESQLAFLIGSCRVWDPELHGWVPGREASARLRWTEVEIDRLRAEVARVTAERDALAAKADPLAGMWAALADYQPQADKDGHGESWRTMCRERTEDAAEIAQDNAWVASISSGLTEPWVAAMCARWAVAWREHSEQNTQQAIAAIRRAEEV